MLLFILLIVGLVLIWAWENSRAQTGSITVGDGSTASTSTSGGALAQMAQAIFEYEGGGKSGATNSWNNNPGNIGGGSKTYPTLADGWNALDNQITTDASNNPSWSFYNFFAHYLGNSPDDLSATSQGNPQAYAQYVAGQLGVDPNDTVSSFLGG